MVHRFICSVFDEMRTAVKIGRIDMLVGLIEEAQILANRMESKLAEYGDMKYDWERYKELKSKIKELKKLDDSNEDEFEDFLKPTKNT